MSGENDFRAAPEEDAKPRLGHAPATKVEDGRPPLDRALALLEHAAANAGFICLRPDECRAVLDKLRA